MTTMTIVSAYPVHTQMSVPAVLAERVATVQAASILPNTQRAYLSDLAQVSSWCSQQGWSSLPLHPDHLCAYLTDRADHLKLSTLRRHLASISKAHQFTGLANPVTTDAVKVTMHGLVNLYGQHLRQAPAMNTDHLKLLLESVKGDSLRQKRDCALLLVGWCAALRRSELASLTWGAVQWQPDGAVLTLSGSKTDKQRTGQKSPLAPSQVAKVCPVKALRRWQSAVQAISPAAAADDAPVFRTISRHGHLGAGMSGQAVASVVTKRGDAVGLVGFTGHSLRRGLIQAAHLAGVGETAIMQTSRHKSVNMVRRYQGDAGLLQRAASRGLLA